MSSAFLDAFRQWFTLAGALLFLLAPALPALAAEEAPEQEKPPASVNLFGILGARGQTIHSAGLGAVYDTAIEEYLSMNFSGQLQKEFDFTFSFNLIRPNDEAANDRFSTGLRMLDNLVAEVKYSGWLARTGFIWCQLSPLTLLSPYPTTRRPLLFDRDPNVGEEKPAQFYNRSFSEGFLKEEVLDPRNYFYGGRGGYNWTFRPLMGFLVQNDELPYGTFAKAFVGKQEAFYDQGIFLTNSGAQVGIDLKKTWDDIPALIEISAFNQANDRGEITALDGNAEEILQNNTVAGPGVKIPMGEYNFLESEIVMSYFNTTQNAWRDWAVWVADTAFLNRIFGFGTEFPLSFFFRRINPDFIGKQNSVIDGASFEDGERRYFTNIGDSQLFYANEQTWYLDAKLGDGLSLLRVTYGGRGQIRETDNRVASTHFLDGTNYNGAVWWHEFFTTFGILTNPAVDAYSANAGFSRRIATDWWRGNTETLFLNDPTPSRKYISVLNIDFRHSLHKSLGFATPLYFGVYEEFQTLHSGAHGSPFYENSALFYQSYGQAVLSWNAVAPLFLVAEYGVEAWRSDQITPAVDYLEQSVGAGFDYQFDSRTYFYLRAKYYEHKDRAVPANDFSALQYWLEFKNYF